MLSQKQIKMISEVKPSEQKQLKFAVTPKNDVGLEIVSDDTEFPVDLDEMQDEQDYEITKVSDDLQQATMDYLAVLVGSETIEYIEEFFGSSEELDILIERIEELLFEEFGLPIYRPRIIQDDDGIEHYVTSLAEAEELMVE